MSDLLSSELPPEAGHEEEEDTSFIDQTNDAYEAALKSIVYTAELVATAAELHHEAKEKIRASMRAGGSLNFGEHCPQNIQRRAANDSSIKDALRALQLSLNRW